MPDQKYPLVDIENPPTTPVGEFIDQRMIPAAQQSLYDVVRLTAGPPVTVAAGYAGIAAGLVGADPEQAIQQTSQFLLPQRQYAPDVLDTAMQALQKFRMYISETAQKHLGDSPLALGTATALGMLPDVLLTAMGTSSVTPEAGLALKPSELVALEDAATKTKILAGTKVRVLKYPSEEAAKLAILNAPVPEDALIAWSTDVWNKFKNSRLFTDERGSVDLQGLLKEANRIANNIRVATQQALQIKGRYELMPEDSPLRPRLQRLLEEQKAKIETLTTKQQELLQRYHKASAIGEEHPFPSRVPDEPTPAPGKRWNTDTQLANASAGDVFYLYKDNDTSTSPLAEIGRSYLPNRATPGEEYSYWYLKLRDGRRGYFTRLEDAAKTAEKIYPETKSILGKLPPLDSERGSFSTKKVDGVTFSIPKDSPLKSLPSERLKVSLDVDGITVKAKNAPAFWLQSRLLDGILTKFPDRMKKESAINFIKKLNVRKEELDGSGILAWIKNVKDERVSKEAILKQLSKSLPRVKDHYARNPDYESFTMPGGYKEPYSAVSISYYKLVRKPVINYTEILRDLEASKAAFEAHGLSLSDAIELVKEQDDYTGILEKGGVLNFKRREPNYYPVNKYAFNLAILPKKLKGADIVIKPSNPIKYEMVPDRISDISHFTLEGEKNQLGWARLTERSLQKEHDTLFVEEIQSDWYNHASAFDWNLDKAENLEALLNTPSIITIDGRLSDYENFMKSEKYRNKLRTDDSIAFYHQKAVTQLKFKKEQAIKSTRKFLQMPFKDTWYELVAKKTLHTALEKGKRYIAVNDADHIPLTERWPLELAAKKHSFAKHFYDKMVHSFYKKFAAKYGLEWKRRNIHFDDQIIPMWSIDLKPNGEYPTKLYKDIILKGQQASLKPAVLEEEFKA